MCVHLYFSLCDIKRQKHAYGIYFLKPCESNIINLSPWFKTLNLYTYIKVREGGVVTVLHFDHEQQLFGKYAYIYIDIRIFSVGVGDISGLGDSWHVLVVSLVRVALDIQPRKVSYWSNLDHVTIYMSYDSRTPCLYRFWRKFSPKHPSKVKLYPYNFRLIGQRTAP